MFILHYIGLNNIQILISIFTKILKLKFDNKSLMFCNAHTMII